MTAADRAAIAFLKQHRTEAMTTLFTGRKLVLAKKWGLSKLKSASKISGAAGSVLPDDRAAALQAIGTMFDREAKVHGVKAASHAIETTAKAGGMFLDAGTVTTSAAAVAGTLSRVLVTLKCLKLDWDETQAANELLKHPGSLDGSLFTASPILGAYFLCCTETSTIVNVLFDDLFQPSFRYRVDRAVNQHLNMVKDKANNLVLEHRMMLDGGPIPYLSVEGDDGRITVRDAGLKAKLMAKMRGGHKI